MTRFIGCKWWTMLVISSFTTASFIYRLWIFLKHFVMFRASSLPPLLLCLLLFSCFSYLFSSLSTLSLSYLCLFTLWLPIKYNVSFCWGVYPTMLFLCWWVKSGISLFETRLFARLMLVWSQFGIRIINEPLFSFRWRLKTLIGYITVFLFNFNLSS